MHSFHTVQHESVSTINTTLPRYFMHTAQQSITASQATQTSVGLSTQSTQTLGIAAASTFPYLPMQLSYLAGPTEALLLTHLGPVYPATAELAYFTHFPAYILATWLGAYPYLTSWTPAHGMYLPTLNCSSNSRDYREPTVCTYRTLSSCIYTSDIVPIRAQRVRVKR